MIILLSPSKTLDFESAARPEVHTLPAMLSESETLIKALRRYSPARLSELMGISDKLATLNTGRYKAFQLPFTPANARHALFAFRGDVYDGLNADAFSAADIAFAQKHLRILSGLYGLLKPLDLIQPYRLEMGTHLPTRRGKDLYAFWDDRITELLNAQSDGPVINLASQEYSKAVRRQKLDAPVIDIVFKERRGKEPAVIGLFAKKARGAMAGYLIRNRISDCKKIQKFTEGGYGFVPSFSDASTWLFVR